MPNISQYMTPGSAVSDTVQEILQKRREQQRQMMLDRMGVMKFGADENQRGIENKRADAELGLNKDRTAAQIAADNAREVDSFIDTTDPNPHDVGDLETTNPKMFHALMERGRIQKKAVPGVSTSTSFPGIDPDGTVDPLSAEEEAYTKPTYEFTGSSDYRKQADARQRLTDYKTQNAKLLAGNPQLSQAIDLILAGGMKDVPDSATEPEPTVTPISPDGNAKPVIHLGHGGKAMELNYPPQVNAVNAPALYQATGPDGVTKSVSLTPSEMSAYTDAGYTLRKGNLPVDPNANKDIVSTPLLKDLASVMGVKGISSTQKQQLISSKMAVIKAQAIIKGVDPEVIDAMNGILGDIDKLKTAGQPIPGPEVFLGRVTGMSPQENAHLAALLQAFYGVIGAQ